MLITKPCPTCHADHGHTPWAVTRSSMFKPLKCHACGGRFHQTGLGTAFVLSWLFPTTLLAFVLAALLATAVPAVPLPAATGVALVVALGANALVVTWVVNRRRPLAPGPRCG